MQNIRSKGFGFARKLVVAALLSSTTCYAADQEGIWSPDGRYEMADPKIFTDVFGEQRAESFRNLDRFTKVTRFSAADSPYLLPENISPLPETIKLKGVSVNLETLLAKSETSSFLVFKDNVLVAETYMNGGKKSDTNTSWSVAKSFVATMIGIAIDQGKIGSVTDKVSDYAASLKGTAYGAATLENILQMSSGVDYSEVYPDNADAKDYVPSDADVSFLSSIHAGGSLDRFVREVGKLGAPGQKFVYRSIDTHVLTLVLRGATGMTTEAFFDTYLWQPLGAPAPAFWNVDDQGVPIGYCCLNMRSRDFARLGLLYLNNGRWNGQQIVSKEWVKAATQPNKSYLEPSTDSPRGYAYQWWVPQGYETDGEFLAIGIWGQHIYVNRANGVVIVRNAHDSGYSKGKFDYVSTYRAVAKYYGKDK